MTLQALEYFIAIAKHQNFTNAAKECFVTQPALSRVVCDLEKELGCKLFLRNSRSVTLTREGEVCLEEAVRVVKQCRTLVERVQDSFEKSEQNRTPLKLGYLIYGHLNVFLRYLSERFPEGVPFQMETAYKDMQQAREHFQKGEIDLLLVPEVCGKSFKKVNRIVISESKAYAILYRTNPLFYRNQVTLEELKDEQMIMWDYRDLPELHRAHLKMFQDRGFTPNIVGEGRKMGDVTALIAQNKAIGFTSKSASFVNSDDFHCIEISDSPFHFGTVCIWSKENLSPALWHL